MPTTLLLCLLMVQPQDPKQEKEVIITSSPLDPHDLFDTPFSADVVDLSDPKSGRLPRTLPDALRETAGVSIQKTGPAQGSPFIRGFTGFRNVMLIDGIRLNNSIFREGPNQYWATVDSFMIDRMEVVRGPSSVLHGSDSMGGTVQAWTRSPEFGEGPLHSRTFGRFAGAERSYSGREEIQGSQGDFGWLLGGSLRKSNDFIGGRHYDEMKDSGYETEDADAKMVYRLSKDSKLILAAQRHRTEDAPRWHSTNDSKGWHGSAAGTDRQRDFDQERDLAYMQYRGTFEGGAIDSLNASLSLHRMEELEDRITSTGARQIRKFEIHTPAFWIQAGRKTSAGRFTAGIDLYHDIVDSEGANVSAGGVVTTFERGNVADNATYDLFGVYLQNEITLGDVDLTPGLRFSRATVDAEDVDPAGGTTFPSLKETYQAVTGSLRAVWQAHEQWNVIAGWGMGFRAPSLDDTTAVSIVLSGALDTPATDLDPEKTQTFDLGFRTEQKGWKLGAFGFYTILDDFIQRVPIGDFNGDGTGDFTRQNFSQGYVYGCEVMASVEAGAGLSFFGDWGYAKGEVDQLVSGQESEQPLAKVGPSLLHLGVRFEPEGTKAWIEALLTAAAQQHHLSVSDGTDTQRIPPGGTPGYGVGTIRAGYLITEKIRATAAVENIGDRDYRIHGSGQNEPGRNFIAAVEIEL